jgi:ribonuclease HI
MKRPVEKEESEAETKRRRKSLEVWTDGSCPGNGMATARAGLGVWFGDGDRRNLSERLEGRQTNQRAELMAAIRALEVLEKETLDKNDQVTLYSDSQYVVQGITSWILKWRAVKWSARVLNKDLWQRLDRLVLAVPYVLQWKHVSAHSGIVGNEAADRLAKAGTLLEARQHDTIKTSTPVEIK